MEPPTARHFSLQEQQMSARKLSRIAGLVLVLAAMFGGVGPASIAVAQTQGANVNISVANYTLVDNGWG
jgi:hypothetical protein